MNVCRVIFDSFEEEIRTIFSNEYLLNCFRAENLQVYRKFFKYENVRKILKSEELMETIESFFENNLNITKAARSCFLHKNTLVYRIEKVKRLLTLDIKNFNDAVLLFNMIYVYKNHPL